MVKKSSERLAQLTSRGHDDIAESDELETVKRLSENQQAAIRRACT